MINTNTKLSALLSYSLVPSHIKQNKTQPNVNATESTENWRRMTQSSRLDSSKQTDSSVCSRWPKTPTRFSKTTSWEVSEPVSVIAYFLHTNLKRWRHQTSIWPIWTVNLMTLAHNKLFKLLLTELEPILMALELIVGSVREDAQSNGTCYVLTTTEMMLMMIRKPIAQNRTLLMNHLCLSKVKWCKQLYCWYILIYIYVYV